MGILQKKIFRDIAHSKFRASIIIVTVLISSALIIGLNNAAINAGESFKKTFDELNVYDINITTEFTSMSMVRELRDSIVNVEEIEARIFLKASLLGVEPNRDFKADWISIPGGRRPRVNDIDLEIQGQGNYFSGPHAAECLVNSQFAKARSIDIDDILTLKYGTFKKQFAVNGITISPEYFYVVDEETGILEFANLGVIFTPLEFTQSLLGQPGMVNQFSVIVNNDDLIDDTVNSIQDFMTQKGVILLKIVKRSESVETNAYETDVGAADEMAYAFGSVIMIVAMVTIYNSVTKLIATQRNYIGVMTALGGRRRKIILHYFNFSLFLSLVGIVGGIIVGFLISFATMNYISVILEVPYIEQTIHFDPIVKGIAYTLGIALTTGLWVAYQATKITPREAMTSSFITEDFARKPFIERLFDLLQRRKRILPRIPLRNLFRRKRRSVITIFTISISMILIISSLSMMESFKYTIDNNFERNETYDLQVLFDQPYPQEFIQNALSQIRGIRYAEFYIQYPCILKTSTSNEPFFTLLKAYIKNSHLRSYHVISGTSNIPPDTVLVGNTLANDLNLTLGQTISLGFTTMKRVKIAGITGELADINFITTIEEAQEILGFDNVINGLLLAVEQGRKQSVKDALWDNLPIKSILDPEDVKKGFIEFLDLINVFVWLLTGLGIFIEVLFVFNTIAMNVSEREMEFITLKALGTPRMRIYKLILYESLFLSVLGIIIGIPAGYITNAYVLLQMVSGFMYLTPFVPFYVLIVVIVVGFVTAISAGLYSARRVDHLNLPDFMRERVIG